MFIAREICHTLVSCVAKMTLSCFLMTFHRLVLFHPFLVITDDLKHDASAVAVFEKAAIDHVRAKGVDNTFRQFINGLMAVPLNIPVNVTQVLLISAWQRLSIRHQSQGITSKLLMAKDHVINLVG